MEIEQKYTKTNLTAQLSRTQPYPETKYRAVYTDESGSLYIMYSKKMWEVGALVATGWWAVVIGEKSEFVATKDRKNKL